MMEDYLAWNFTRNGIFTVRSAYHLKMSMKRARTGQHESSNSVNKHKGYMALWESNAPAKAKIHMWRIIRNGLAVGAELFRRRIKSGVFCVACGREETIIHRFWACQHSVQFWQLMRSELGVSVAIPPSSLDSQSALASWILDWFAGASDDEREVLIQAAYGLWLARNEARDGKKIAPPHEVVASVRAHMAEWKLVHAVTARQPVAKTIQKWEPPAEGWIKVNSDGAVSKHGGSGGGGVVLRDHNGAFLAGACHHLPHTADPEAAEVLACRRAVQLAIEHDVRRLHLELDSSSVVQMIKLEAKNMSTVGPWVSDIKELLNSREEFKVSWISRTGNVATHRLAKSTPTQPTGLSIPFPCAPATPLRRAPPYHGGRKGKLAVPERSWLIESERRLASLLALGATEPNSRSPRSASTHLCSHKVLYTPCLLRCCSFRCITMVSEDGDISALLSEPNLPEEQAVTSGSDDFLAAILESIKSNEKEVELSPEEAAWADSCFVQTSELSDVDWGAMTQALLDTLKEPMEGSCDTTEVMHEQGTHVLSEAESHALRVEKHTQDDNVDMEQRGSSDDDEDATEVDEVTHVIRGTDEHGRQMDGYTAKSDDDDELVSSEVLEQAESRDSIFKVWDLDVSFSEDESEPELIKDLKKLLRGNPQEAAYPPPSDAAKALSEINVDELVAGLSNLSLQRTSG